VSVALLAVTKTLLENFAANAVTVLVTVLPHNHMLPHPRAVVAFSRHLPSSARTVGRSGIELNSLWTKITTTFCNKNVFIVIKA
jgi:hypothetical protein